MSVFDNRYLTIKHNIIVVQIGILTRNRLIPYETYPKVCIPTIITLYITNVFG